MKNCKHLEVAAMNPPCPEPPYKSRSSEESKKRVIQQLNNVGFHDLPYDIPIILLNQTELLEHEKIKALFEVLFFELLL